MCGLCISSISITWTLVRNAHFHILLRIYWIRNSGVGIQPSVIKKKKKRLSSWLWPSQPLFCCFVAKLCLTLWDPWTVACQALLSVGFHRQECWNGLPFPSPGDFPNPGMEPMSPALTGRFIYLFFYRRVPREAHTRNHYSISDVTWDFSALVSGCVGCAVPCVPGLCLLQASVTLPPVVTMWISPDGAKSPRGKSPPVKTTFLDEHLWNGVWTWQHVGITWGALKTTDA